jgi:two-component system chemotaxis response regulator CheB
MSCSAIVMGGSAGGIEALIAILAPLPAGFALPLLIVQHLNASDGGCFAQQLARAIQLPVSEPSDKERIEPGRVYTAPANYHMLVEDGNTISLSVDDKVNWSRPSIDVLFASAARAWKSSLTAIILSGASADGAEGIRAVKAVGGLTIAQNPLHIGYPFMPQAAIATGAVDEVLDVDRIGRRLIELVAGNPAPTTAIGNDKGEGWRAT